MLELSNRYLHGYVAIPVILACLEKSFFDLLNKKKNLSIPEISQTLGANEGHLKVALRLFESLNWLKRRENGFELVMPPHDYEFIQSIPKQLLDWYGIPNLSLLKGSKYRRKLRWGLEYLNKTSFSPTSMLTDFSHGVVIVPLLLALKEEYFLDALVLDQPLSLTHLPKDIEQLIVTFFLTKAWAKQQKNGCFLTESGKFLLERVLNLGTVASYAPMLSKMPELLFGDTKKVFKRDDHDHELHVDRSLNVLASGFQHERYFTDVEEMIISIFNRKPYESQPHYVIDMGCGDGSLLKRIYEIICAQTERGKLIREYPVVMIGVDYNQKSLEATRATLKDIPHYTLQGDIADPKRLIDDLKTLGIKDPENSLHVRSFLDHDRPFILPSKNKGDFRSRISYQGVYVDKKGNTIPAALAIQSLVEHLQNWSSIINKHGLIVLEVHCLTPQAVYSYLDQSESLHFDAYHAFSMQHLVEADVFLLSAAEVGLFSNPKYSKRYPNVFPFTRITLSYFEKRDYSLDYAKESDLLRLVGLEAHCWPEHLRISHEVLSQRIQQFPEGQLVMKMKGEIIGAVYTQRIANIDLLKQTPFKEVGALHTPEGPIMQLTGINIIPEMQDRGLGDQLLEFVLQWCSFKGNIEKIVGVTRCKNYQQHSQLTLQEYVDRHTSNSKGIDPILRFHTSHGAKIVEILPNYRPEDRDNQGAGVLIEYDLSQRRSHRLEANQDREKALAQHNVSSEAVYDCIVELVPQKYASQFSPTLSLRDMGFDSLGLLELKTLLNQRFKLSLDATFFFQYSTPAAIASYLQNLENPSPPSDFQSASSPIHRGDIEESSSHLMREKSQAIQPSLSSSEPIAIIGMACRFPGKINNLTDFWEILKGGHDVVSKVPPERLERGTIPETSFEGGYLEEVDTFDPSFFRISPREAQLMDPQQRLLLEVTWQALEEAGIDPKCLKGSQTGVFIGIFSHDYETLINKNQSAETLDAYFGTGNSASVAAGRLSYIFGFQGPSLAVNTACSSSLVAVHLACQSLRLGESSMAIAGGVNLILSPELGTSFSNAGMLSPDGRCKTFDISANGYGRSEGCGVVILKPISQALKDGDRVLAILPNSSVNQDGASNGLSAPNMMAQKDLIQASFKNTHFEPRTISYVEAHGTGTRLGDPIEIKALAEAYGQARTKENPLIVGSVKTNIGHAEAAAGIAGLIKVVLALQHKEIPPHVHFTQLNPHIDFDTSSIQIPTALLPWLANQEHPRRGAVSSFGFSGTNAHVLVEEGPEVLLSTQQQKPYYLVTLSAKNKEALAQHIANLHTHLKTYTKLPLEPIAYTLNVGRGHFNHRCAFVIASIQELQVKLGQVEKHQNPAGFFQGDTKEELKDKAIYDRVLKGAIEELKNHLYQDDNEYKKLLEALGNLYLRGYDLDWVLLHKGEAHQKISLPTYPFLKERYWFPDFVPPTMAHLNPLKKSNNLPDESYTVLEKVWKAAPSEDRSKAVPSDGHLIIFANHQTTALAQVIARKFKSATLILNDKSKSASSQNALQDFLFMDFDRADAGTKTGQTLIKSCQKGAQLIDLSDLGDDFSTKLSQIPWGKFSLLQQLIANISAPISFFHITQGLVSWRCSKPSLNGAIMAGLVRSLGAEYGKFQAKTIDIDLSLQEIEAISDLISFEFVREEAEGEVCYRNRRRYFSAMETLTSLPLHSLPVIKSTLAVDSERVYVVTGGTRGIGAVMAKHLVSHGARKLVLMGREQLPPRSEWNAYLNSSQEKAEVTAKLQQIIELERSGVEVELYMGPLTDSLSLTSFFTRIRQALGPIGGIVHCAGTISLTHPAFIHKTVEEMEAVCEPKVLGLMTLHQIFLEDSLDFFLLFSSISGLIPTLGVGVSDYAFANAFMDYFAAYHASQGHSYYRSIQWPLWRDVGMIRKVNVSLPYRELGLCSHSVTQGVELLNLLIEENPEKTCLMPGLINTQLFDPMRLLVSKPSKSFQSSRQLLTKQQSLSASPSSRPSSESHNCLTWLRNLFATELKLPHTKLDDDTPFGEWGVDSILLAELVKKIEGAWNVSISPSLFLEYPTLAQISKQLESLYPDHDVNKETPLPTISPKDQSEQPLVSADKGSRSLSSESDTRVAVIGIACHFPGATDKEEFWKNLCHGVCSIQEIPSGRWEIEKFYSPSPQKGKSISKWGGFIEGIEYFDPTFFGFENSDAANIDPLIKQCLEVSAQVLCDAGYQKKELGQKKVGVFVGSRVSTYAQRVGLDKSTIVATGQNFISAHISHFFNFTGPSLVIDTACSSSLVSVHQACQSLLNGESEICLAGGVDILLDETLYLALSEAKALSPDGICHTFDEKANGFVPGEGCGMVLLKPLSKATEEGDRIYAVIEASGMNNDGHTMGITTPDPKAQQALIEATLKKGKISSDTIGYVETHGTGTAIGDPIELKALSAVFGKSIPETPQCAVGSVKTNIGHLLSAAGIASFIKVALSLHYKKIPPTLHCEIPNPRFDFAHSPFCPNQALQDWLPRQGVRRASISSFGFGGTNAHLIMRETKNSEIHTRTRSPLPAITFQRQYCWRGKKDNQEKEESSDEQFLKPKTFNLTLTNDNEIVRDHHVYEVRILPGVTFLDMIYRFIGKEFKTKKFVLKNILFHEPVATSQEADRIIRLSLIKQTSHWNIEIQSQKSKADVPLESSWLKNATCELYLGVSDAQIPLKALDIDLLKQKSEKTFDLEELYASTRQMGIWHGEFMKPSGRVYQSADSCLMEVILSPLAQAQHAQFYLHPAMLDASTFMLFATRPQVGIQTEPPSSYIPLFIKRFQAFATLPETCYVYAKKEHSQSGSIDDVVLCDLQIYHPQGHLLAYFEQLTGKRIRTQASITQLTAQETKQTADLSSISHKASSPVSKHLDISPLEESLSPSIQEDLQKRIGSFLDKSSSDIDTATNFYELGLDSKQLVTLVRDLEVQLGCQLYPTLLFEYNTVAKLTDYLAQNHSKAYEAVRLSGEKNSTQVKGGSIGEKTTAIQEGLQMSAELQDYTPLWMNQPIPINLKKQDLPFLKSLCILSDDIEFVEAFRQHLTPVPVIQLKSGQSYRKLNEMTYQVNITERSSYEAYLKGFTKAGYSFSHVLFTRGAEKSLEHLREVLFFTQTLLRNHVKGPLYGISLSVYHKDEGVSSAWMSAGFARSLRLEQPVYHWDTLEVEADQSTQSLIECLCAEWCAVSQNTITTHARYREGKRQTQQHTLIHPETHSQTTGLFRQGGVYLITGGLGGIGIHVAGFLAKEYQAKLILTGRSPLAGEQKEALQGLLEQGGEAVYLSGDVTSLETVQDWLVQAKTRFGKLNGVIHSAGVIADSLLIEKQWETFNAVLAPKVIGTANLDEVTAQESLDFFVLFSSLTSVLGNVGQTDYSSANAFMDGFAVWREELVKMGKRSGKTRSINWPLWAGGGMQVNESTEKYLNHLGFAPLPTEKGLTALITSLKQPQAQCMVMYGSQLLLQKSFAQSLANDIVMSTPSAKISSSKEGELPAVVKQKDSDIAIIGVSGLYSGADNLDQLWKNLTLGRDAITEIPSERWDWRLYYDVDKGNPGKSYSKWGSFLQDYDKFDPLFFNISPREAELMDPQERLFLQVAWQTFEDAGYVPGRFNQPELSSLSQKHVGVFVGVMFSLYQLYSSEENLKGPQPSAINSSTGSIANRVSYYLDLQGPSFTLDTMCSSSLTAIHLACESLRRGECQLALAGGVNLITHPSKYVFLSQSGFLASDGRCKSFGEGGDGYVPGEGVGAVLLKPLSKALADGDRIWGIVKSTSMNHGGYTAGYSVPSAEAQSALIKSSLEKAHIPAESLSYVEAHGTGTSLGDPIEIRGLCKAFEGVERQTCSIGSIKSNLGHLESAAGIAALTKVLLQFKHRQLVPSIHAETLNSQIPFAETPFYVQRELANWQTKAESPLRASISSFGAGGSNAHLILEEAPKQLLLHRKTKPYYLVALSAKHQDSLEQHLADLHIYLKNCSDISLESLAYTLNVGRSHFNFRCAVVASSIEEFKTTLEKLQLAQPSAGCFRGQADKAHEDGAIHKKMLKGIFEELKTIGFSDLVTYKENIETLANLYVKGYELDWKLLHHGESHQKVSLPTYPFLKERYWIAEETPFSLSSSQSHSSTQLTSRLHPLLDHNISTLEGQCYQTLFQIDAFYLRDHVIKGKKILPGVCSLEMARIGGELAYPSSTGVCGLKNVIWSRPILVENPRETYLYLIPKGEQVEYEIHSKEGTEYSLHSQGEVLYGEIPACPEILDIRALRQSMGKEFSNSELYEKFRAIGIHYGSSFQGLQWIRSDGKRMLGYVQIPQELFQAKDYSSYFFHPSFLDSVLQTIVGFSFYETEKETKLPFSIEEVKWFVSQLPEKAYVLVEAESIGAEEMPSYELKLVDEKGNLILHIKGLITRVLDLKKNFKNFSKQNVSSNQAELTFYQPSLEEAPLSSRSQANASVTGVLTVDVSPDGCERLKATLNCTVVSFSKQDLIDYETLPKKIAALPTNISHLLYLVSSEKEDDTALTEENLFSLTKELLISNQFSTLSSYYVCRSSGKNPPFPKMVSGFIKSLEQEQPSYHYRLLTCEAKCTEAEVLSLWLQEVNHDVSPGAVICYQKGKRYEEHFQPINLQNETNNQIPLREKGTYLISGGLGGLGFLFARYLASRYQAKLILIGRSVLDDSKAVQIEELEKLGSEVLYVPGDISQKSAVQNILEKGKDRFGILHGIIHSAGVLRDSLIVHKSIEDFRAVLASKVEGLIHLDTLTAEEPLELFTMFSSMSSVLGNVGQSDYASANAFLDHFAHWRQTQVQMNCRSGKTLSINWPLWLEGGMQIDFASQEYMESHFGMKPLPTDKGFEAFEQLLSLSVTQGIVVYGETNSFLEFLSHLTSKKEVVSQNLSQDKSNTEMLDIALLASTQSYLKKLLQNKLKLPEQKLDIQTTFDQYGLDSILVLGLIRALEKDFGLLPKTLFFEYRTITELSRYFVQSHKRTLEELFKEKMFSQQEEAALSPNRLITSQYSTKNQLPLSARFLSQKTMAQQAMEDSIQTSEEIAIVGLSGRYPNAKNLEEFWGNLQQGQSAIREIPKERWDWSLYYDSDKSKVGKSYSKWGSFIQDFDKFDPLFFNISPREAELMDPQERLFLEVVWATLEDAGYTPEGLNQNTKNKIGVFVGVMYGPYQLYGPSQDNLDLPTSSYASIANRVSYALNFHGPSLAVDTMCSSSLTAIHLACESIKHGECETAIAGGVNITSHPSKYLVLSQGRFLSSDGLCKSFGEGGDGYVPGEGVGAVLLKPLSQALNDRDEIYGVIKGSAVNHGGTTNGYSVPNPVAQGEVIQNALKQARVAPQSLSYMEAHGTGTSLGDPIEIRGLDKAFEGVKKESCPIGSIKSNLGHLESAAGIAALTKVLLQLKHKQLVPSIHADTLNPNIDLKKTPFYVQRELGHWQPVPGYLRRAGVSSFGAGGSNAHLILEEAPENNSFLHKKAKPYYLVTLSAKHSDSLKSYIVDLCRYLKSHNEVSLEALAYTLNTGRGHFSYRYAVVVPSIEDLKNQLEKLEEEEQSTGSFEGYIENTPPDSSKKS